MNHALLTNIVSHREALQSTHSDHMQPYQLPQWPGYHALKAGSRSHIDFKDIKYLHEHCSPLANKTIDVYNIWAAQMVDICKAATPADSVAVKGAQLRDIARVLLRLLEALCLAEPSGEPHLQPGAELWKPPDCPLQCRNKSVLNVHQSAQQKYPKARLMLCKLHEGVRVTERHVVEVQLHRFACWLSKGNPGPDTQLACHECGTPSCVRLGCLDWGNASTNQQEAYDKPRRRPKR